MDKDIPQPIQHIRDSTSFEGVLQLASNFIPIQRKDIRTTRAIDVAWKARRTFTFKDWISLHELGISLWFRQYSRSSISFKFDRFPNRDKLGYKEFQELIDLLLQNNERLIELPEGESLRDESLKTWKDFIAGLVQIGLVEAKSGTRRKKIKLNDDSLFAILSILALILGMLLAVLVSFVR
ncbi:hypothetical protein [Kamptonema formosum]|uniref:hypothetical protein n=1 Tax=Kamptonema formosum TaxID=331992 RepID=UPI00036A7425|nr:hypothetical protein [Oscillatoria sp. PCC 10802]